jgi:hypothetical protein
MQAAESAAETHLWQKKDVGHTPAQFLRHIKQHQLTVAKYRDTFGGGTSRNSSFLERAQPSAHFAQ